MTKDELIRLWKDEAFREKFQEKLAEYAEENPVGEAQLDDAALEGISGGAEEGTTITVPITIGASVAMSCYPSCSASFHDGTCNAFSVGCCPTE